METTTVLAICSGILAWGGTVAGIAWWAGRLQERVEGGIARAATTLDLAKMTGHAEAQVTRIAEMEKDVAHYSRWKHDTITPVVQRLEARVSTLERDVDNLQERPRRRSTDGG